MSISISLSLSIHVYMYTCMCIYIYIYTYLCISVGCDDMGFETLTLKFRWGLSPAAIIWDLRPSV